MTTPNLAASVRRPGDLAAPAAPCRPDSLRSNCSRVAEAASRWTPGRRRPPPSTRRPSMRRPGGLSRSAVPGRPAPLSGAPDVAVTVGGPGAPGGRRAVDRRVRLPGGARVGTRPGTRTGPGVPRRERPGRGTGSVQERHRRPRTVALLLRPTESTGDTGSKAVQGNGRSRALTLIGSRAAARSRAGRVAHDRSRRLPGRPRRWRPLSCAEW